MKKILLLVLMFGLSTMSYSAQESAEKFEHERQIMIKDAVRDFSYLTQGFDFLGTHHFVATTFHDFLEQHVSNDQDTDMNFDQLIIDAEKILTDSMKDTFLNILTSALKEAKNVDEFDDPIFLYVMVHKDDDMRDMVRLWLYEWSKVKDKNGRTPLHEAVMQNLRAVAVMLIDAGADVNIQDNNDLTALHFAAIENRREIAILLIDAGAKLNVQDKDAWTALHVAAIKNTREIAILLIEAGADVNIEDNNGWTPLMWAVIQNLREIVILFIDAGAQLNVQDKHGWTPLMWAAFHNSREVAVMLIDAGADLNLKQKQGRIAEQLVQTPQMRAIFAQARQEKSDAQAMARFEKQIQKDWR